MVSIKWMSLLTPTRQGGYGSKSISQKACPWLALTKMLTHVIVSKPQPLHKSLENVVNDHKSPQVSISMRNHKLYIFQK